MAGHAAFIKLKEWLDEGKHTDFSFVFRCPRQPNLLISEAKAHKSVVCSRSDVFEQAHGSNNSTKSQNKFEVTVKSLVEVEQFRSFLNYLYTDIMEPDTLVGIIKFALKYHVIIFGFYK